SYPDFRTAFDRARRGPVSWCRLRFVVRLVGKPVPTFPDALSALVVRLIGKPVPTFPDALSTLVVRLIGKPVPTFPDALRMQTADGRS
ncbi:MAG: hypothetical protein RL291_1111, partial [Pseudomonadota bacterium]